ncbi:MAG: multidrug ABC transporter ATP-binding protein [Chloroflexi bacterium]|nr:MAG: multidrug ABC transporter ATP-binding protein [Chloroflexota bacterium]
MIKNEHVIITKNLTRAFGENLAVNQLSLTVDKGEVFGLLGPNGAGKTTTVRMLAALLVPTSGEAWVAGCQAGVDDQGIRQKIGLLPESPGLYDALTAEQNLAFYGEMYGVENKNQQIQRYLELLGLWNRRFEPVGTFSKGMRQKLAIARALLHEPEVLFLDEPTSGLDPQAARLVRDFIAELKEEGRTIILTTHNLEEADRLCDRVAVISGHLLALDSPRELRRKLFGRRVVFHLLEANQRLASELEKFDFVTEAQVVENKILVAVDDPEEQNPCLIRALVESGAEIQFVGELRRRLEDVYLELMGAVKGNQHE